MRSQKRLAFWLKGHIIIKNFISLDEVNKIREYTQSLDWATGELGVEHGVRYTCGTNSTADYDSDAVFSASMLSRSKEICERILSRPLFDVKIRSLGLGMHSPIWHIDMQTFENDQPFAARSKNFRAVKCGLYLQGADHDGSGILEVKGPFLGGSLSNLLDSPLLAKIYRWTLARKAIRHAFKLSECHQFIPWRLQIEAGDLLIFDVGLVHRASQSRTKSIFQDRVTGYYVNTTSQIKKIMLQWEFATTNMEGRAYAEVAEKKSRTLL